MNWSHKINALNLPPVAMPREEILPLVDLTRLDTNATASEISNCAAIAEINSVGALCILPEHLHFIPKTYSIPCATVINFPTGNDPHASNLSAIEQAASHPTLHEIDYVFPYQAYLTGNKTDTLSHCQEASRLSKQHNLLFKVILETGALPSLDVIYQLSLDVIAQGCDFLKTSTGKVAVGATIPAAIAMLSAIFDSEIPCGIKFSGGIKTIEQASAYVRLAEHMQGLTANKQWVRLGMSQLL
jgi:deoxyribose-phosphate aldolase